MEKDNLTPEEQLPEVSEVQEEAAVEETSEVSAPAVSDGEGSSEAPTEDAAEETAPAAGPVGSVSEALAAEFAEPAPETAAGEPAAAPEAPQIPEAPSLFAGFSAPEAPAAPVGPARFRIKWLGVVKALAVCVAAVAALVLVAGVLVNVLLNVGSPAGSVQSNPVNVAIMDRYDMQMTNQISSALDGVLSIKKTYWLNDDDLIAPEPDQSCYGETDDPSSLQWLLDEADDMLAVGETTFSLDIQIQPGTKVLYYLDETIFVITWKQIIDNCIYTFSEVKIAHPSQFRRFLAGGEYGSDKQFITTDMAATVNAVMASSGDFYKFRSYGIIVYDGVVQRCNGWAVDTCFIDDQGDLHFAKAGQIVDIETAQKFVDDNNIRFSLAFGPVLVDNYKRCNPHEYLLGEIDDRFPRAALCQKDDLHYVIIVSNHEGEYWQTPKLWEFAMRVETYGFEKAYTLDGGQTAVIAMNDQLINSVHYGYQRQISDIFYFATAIPNGE